jgi:VWFA-related protein
MRRLAAAALLMLGMQEKLVESIEVHVVNVDVVVTDRAGNPVTGLQRGDFELYENGKPQAISNFYEVNETPLPAVRGEGGQRPAEGPAPAPNPPPPEARARRIIIFVDDYSVEPRQRAQVLDSLDKFIDTQMREGDSATLITWSRRTHVIAPFTTDRAALKAALGKMKATPASIKSRMDDQIVRSNCLDGARTTGRGRAQARDDCFMQIEARIDEQWALERDLLEAMRLTLVSLAGLEGKKAMVIAGAHLPETPGLTLYQFFNQVFGGGRGPDPHFSAGHRSQHLSIAGLAREANANGVTMYLIDTADSRDASSADMQTGMSIEESFLDFTNTAQAYQTLASITGGMSLANTTNLNRAFEVVARDLSSYYSLGYRPADDKSAGDRKLSVRMKNPAWRARARSTYTLKSAEQQMSDKVLANIFNEGMKSEWPIALRIGTPKKDGRYYLVPVEVTVPATVTLLPAEGDKLAGGFDVYIAVGNDDGAMSNVTRRAQPIKIPSAVEKVIRSKPLIFNAALRVRPGNNTISIGVVDEISNTSGFARTRIVAR